MKKELGILVAVLIATSIIPIALAGGFDGGSASVGIKGGLSPKNLYPTMYVNPEYRITDATSTVNRINKYVFNGEVINWDIWVSDLNGAEDVNTVTVEGVVCAVATQPADGDTVKWAKVGTENVTFDLAYMKAYTCTLTVGASIGSDAIVIGAVDRSGGSSTYTENWYLNPSASIGVSGELEFAQVVPGQTHKSLSQVIITNNAPAGSGVQMKVMISGNDFTDTTNANAKCPTTDVLDLSNFMYFASAGDATTRSNAGVGTDGYDSIPKGTKNDAALVMDSMPSIEPGVVMNIRFQLTVPSPCNGNFNNGEIKFWGTII